MRITFKILLFLWFTIGFFHPVSAVSPLDVLNKYLPDIAVADIYQETRFLYMKVCNIGWVLNDSENTLLLALWIPGGWIVSKTESVVWIINSCHDFQIASLEGLKIVASGKYSITAGAVIKNGRTEKVKGNNKMIKMIDIVFPSKTPVTPVQISTHLPMNNNSVVPYCTSSNSYCNNFSSYYANSDLYYRSNICPSWDVACNDSYYATINDFNQNTATRYCTVSNNYCSNNNYFPNNAPYNCTASNNYCNNYQNR